MLKNVIVISDGLFHPPWIGRFWLKRIFSRMQGYRFIHENNMEKLLKLQINYYQGLVLYYHHKKISDQAMDVFEKFVSSGGGVLAIHSTTASFKDCNRFTDIIGGKFSGHGQVQPYYMNPVSPESEIFQEIPVFRVKDELYIHDLLPDITVHFTATHYGQEVPTVWTRAYGKGRVCYTCPGHKSYSMRLKEYEQVLKLGLGWVCGNGR